MNEKDKAKLIADCQECVGPGWSDILKRLIDDLLALGWNGGVLQVKEKFGVLRFYVGSASREIHDRIWAAEKQSAEVCEECGAPGQPRDDGWVKTLCDEHAKQRKEKP